MAVATYTPTTSSDLEEIWRKVQTKVQKGLEFGSDEYMNLDDLQEFEVDWSSREITVPLDINEGAGIASIQEGGYEARPSSPEVAELSLSWVLFNGRFTVTKTSHWVEERSPRALLTKQMKYQAMKKVQDLGRHFGDYFYGFSTGVLCETTTAATQSSGTYSLNDGYGQSGIDNAAYIARMFKVGDYVALVRSGSLVTNAIGQVTAVSASTPSITVTWNGSVTSVAADQVVKANSLENETLAGGTDYNKGLVGLLDMVTSTSVHSLSSSSVANWDVAYSDTGGGRFTGVKIHRARQEIQNEGGGDLNCIYVDQGVERDMVALQQAAVRFSSPFNMEMDGSVKTKGTTIKAWKRVPPGYAFPVDRRSIRKMTLLPTPDESGNAPVWDDGEKVTDRSAYVFNIDWPVATVCLNRKNLTYFSGLTTQ